MIIKLYNYVLCGVCIIYVCVQVNSGGEAMVEVVDGWLARLYPNTPTWREIADVVEQIGHHQLSQSIKQVYVTGGGERTMFYQ